MDLDSNWYTDPQGRKVKVTTVSCEELVSGYNWREGKEDTVRNYQIIDRLKNGRWRVVDPCWKN